VEFVSVKHLEIFSHFHSLNLILTVLTIILSKSLSKSSLEHSDQYFTNMANSHQKLLSSQLALMLLLSVLNFPSATLAEDQCVYSFAVPTTEGGCPGQGVLEQEVKVLKDSDKILREQMASLMTQQAILLKEFTTKTSEMCTKQQQCLETSGGTTGVADGSASTGSGVAYTRWGRTTCPGKATALYKGYVASSYFQEGYGGGTNYLCLPEVPQWANKTQNGYQGGAKLFGTEYEFVDFPFSTVNNGGQSLLQNDAPCVSCYVPTRTAFIMIPARVDCPSGWTKEYGGFLVTSHHGHQNNKDYVCLDEAPEAREGGTADTNGALFYFVETTCTALPCPKYVDGWEAACVVCSK